MNKQRWTADQMVAALTKCRGLINPAAAEIGCDQQTVRNYAKRYPTVARAVTDQRERLIDSAELRLIQAVEQKGEPWAIAMVLKTLGRNRGYVERSEVTGKDGGPIEQAHEHRLVLDDCSVDELVLLERISERSALPVGDQSSISP